MGKDCHNNYMLAYNEKFEYIEYMFVGNTRGLGETLHCVGSYSQMVWKINCFYCHFNFYNF